MAGVQDFDRTPLLLSKTQRRLYLLPLMASSGHQNDVSGEPWTLSTVGTNGLRVELGSVTREVSGNPDIGRVWWPPALAIVACP